MSPRKRAFMKVLGAGSRDAPDKNQKHGFCLFILEVNGYAEVIPGDPIRAITCRVEMWRGGLGAAYLLPALFCRCLIGLAMLPFPHPAHRTGCADFPLPALGEDSRNRCSHCM